MSESDVAYQKFCKLQFPLKTLLFYNHLHIKFWTSLTQKNEIFLLLLIPLSHIYAFSAATLLAGGRKGVWAIWLELVANDLYISRGSYRGTIATIISCCSKIQN